MALRAFPAVSAFLVLAGVSAWSSRASCFEKQWHVGGGLGAVGANEFELGPAANLYGAYGLSDVFDLRLEAFISTNDDPPVQEDPNANPPTPRIAGRSALFYGAKLGLVYKIDVIEWIPYAGVTAGFLGVVPHAEVDGVEADPSPFAKGNATAGVMLGLDYAVSRSFGLGLGLFGDYALHAAPPETDDPDKERRDAQNPLWGAAFLRAEYRFGW